MKHVAGDCFISNEDERIVITGINKEKKRYYAYLYYKHEVPRMLQYMTDEYLDGFCVKMTTKQKELFVKANYYKRGTIELMAKTNVGHKQIRYKIWYIDKSKKSEGSWKADNSILVLGSVKALAKRLNGLVKANPQYKIVAVSVVNKDGVVKKHVKLLTKEINEQKFITGYKERLLAYAKYELGYDISV